MSQRKYFKLRIGDLEQIFKDAGSDIAVLEELEEELSHRSTQRAIQLMEAVRSALGGASSILEERDSGKSETIQSVREGSQGALVEPPTIDWGQALSEVGDSASDEGEEHVSTPTNNYPGDILEAWTVLETLSPQTYKKPDDLVVGAGSVAWLKPGQLEPWIRGEKSRPKNNLYYVVYLGAIDVERATGELLKVFNDGRPERPQVRGLAPLAAVLLDKKGIPIPETGLAISSFGWAYARTLKGKLNDLKGWEVAEDILLEGLQPVVYPKDEEGRVLPFSLDRANKAFRWLVENCDIPESDAREPSFAIRRYQPFSKGEPEPPLLNSFFLDDLQRAKREIHSKSAGKALNQYLGVTTPDVRRDLMSDKKQLEWALQPKYTPAARWPGKGRHPLVLLQQTAVNLCRRELNGGGLFSVNGPPGTGKTTLLRDIVASVQVDRAKALCAFERVDDAFTHAGQMRIGGGFVHLYQLDDSLRGHEVLVASSNNKAVENISKELPLRAELAEDFSEFEYFRPVSDALAGGTTDTWGLIAAVLGNARNRSEFINKAWWDDSSGLRKYFLALSGQNVDSTDADGNVTVPRVVLEGDPPSSPQEAQRRWMEARQTFTASLRAVDEATKQAQRAYENYGHLIELNNKIAEHHQQQGEIKKALSTNHESMQTLEKEKHQVVTQLEAARNAESTSWAHKPNIFIRLVHRRRWREWKDAYAQLALGVNNCERTLENIRSQFHRCDSERSRLNGVLQELTHSESLLKGQKENALAQIEKCRSICGDKLVTDVLWGETHHTQQNFSPTFTRQVQELRDEVFLSAIKVQKAFIDAAAKQIRQNLGAFFYLLSGGSLRRDLQHLVPDLWSTGFLLTPVISTTFASVGRMLKGMPKESIGWLLIDEAGQATPQAAVGAVYRSKRVVSVGDPLQIEPVVTLPEELVDSVSRHFGVEPYQRMAPYASVQTLSDMANTYGTTLPRGLNEIWIGAPLLVHRRCQEPMFSISNDLAYNNMMVQATKPSASPLADVFSSDADWIDIKGTAEEKWCPEEGEHVCRMLLQACEHLQGDPGLFVITPFRRVAERMRQRMCTEIDRLESLGISDAGQWIQNSIGTVHTFQGKQARGVIFLLGAPSPAQNGARNWATNNVNLLNVAVSRAKQNFYVVGNRELWGNSGNMKRVNALISGEG